MEREEKARGAISPLDEKLRLFGLIKLDPCDAGWAVIHAVTHAVATDENGRLLRRLPKDEATRLAKRMSGE